MTGRGWRPLLRIAWRDARRSRGRSILVLVLIALPVLAVSAASVLVATVDTTTAETLDRTIGSASALVRPTGSARVVQAFDPNRASGELGDRLGRPAGPARLQAALGRDATWVALEDSWETRFETPHGLGSAAVLASDWDSPLTAGLTRFVQGRYPRTPDEVAVNQALRDRGAVSEGLLTLADGTRLRVTGTVESAIYRDHPFLTAAPDSAAITDGERAYLMDAGPVSWDDVVALNGVGALVTSRSVITDPPSTSVLTGDYSGLEGGRSDNTTTITVLALVVAMVLIEVVLLAGPAFAVGARRQSRTMALMAASGGTPQQSRRLVLATAVVLGSLAALGGAGLGVLLGIALLPVAQRFSGEWLGPAEVPWPAVVGVMAFGLVAALLAAFVPAHLASKQDVVAVLAGRRGDAAPSRRTPVLGVLVLAAGVAAAVLGSVQGDTAGSLLIAGAAIVCVLGMLLVVPLVVALVARAAGRLPLALRFAARDAHRHRTRTVPAVAAVAATVAGVVALGIATTSDAAGNRATYQAALPAGAGVVSAYGEDAVDVLSRIADGLARQHPGLDLRVIRGVPYPETEQDPDVSVEVGEDAVFEFGAHFGGQVLAGPLPPFVEDQDPAELAAAERALAAGQAVVFVSAPLAADEVQVTATWFDPRTGETRRQERLPWPAHFLTVRGSAPAMAVLPEEVFSRIGVEAAPSALYLPGPVDVATQQVVEEQVRAVSTDSGLYVERGYQTPDEDTIVQLVLAGLGTVLMLGGTLTATFLALSDARPDLATLSAVGAAPRTRRFVAAAYALVVGLVGAVLGAVVGTVPGLAIARVLTTTTGYVSSGSGGFSGELPPVTGPFIDVPWLLVAGIVVGLPLLTAAVVGLVARSRLPMVARLD